MSLLLSVDQALWSVTAGLLAGQIVYLLVASSLGALVSQSDSRIVPALLIGLIVLVLTTLAFWRTTERGPAVSDRRAGMVPVAAIVIGGFGIVNFWFLAPVGSSGATALPLVLGSIVVVAIVAVILWLSSQRTD